LIGVLIMGGVLIMLLTLYYFPVNPEKPYFPELDDRVGGVHWHLGSFQPVYLFTLTKGNDYYIKVAYRDKKNIIRTMDVFVGRKGAEEIPFSKVYEENDNSLSVEEIDDYGEYFSFGDRVSFLYLRNVLKRNGDAFDIVEPNEEIMMEICEVSDMLCLSAKLAQTNPDEFWSFSSTKSFDNSLVFPAISLKKDMFN